MSSSSPAVGFPFRLLVRLREIKEVEEE